MTMAMHLERARRVAKKDLLLCGQEPHPGEGVEWVALEGLRVSITHPPKGVHVARLLPCMGKVRLQLPVLHGPWSHIVPVGLGSRRITTQTWALGRRRRMALIRVSDQDGARLWVVGYSLLAIGGVEPNPGPRLSIRRPGSVQSEPENIADRPGPASAHAEDGNARDPADPAIEYPRPGPKVQKPRREQKEFRGEHRSTPGGQVRAQIQAGVDVLQQQVKKEMAQIAGVHDAEEARRVEMERARLDALALQMTADAAQKAELIQSQTRFVGVCWHSCVPDEVEADYCMVAREPQTLLRPFFPHRWLLIANSSIHPAQRFIVDGAKVKSEFQVVQQPMTADMARAPGPYNILELDVELHNVGWFQCEHEDRGVQTVHLSFSWEQWTAASSQRVASTPSFLVNLKAVQRWRSSHKGFPCSDNVVSANSLIEDQAFTALLMSRDRGLSQIWGIGKEVFFKESNKRIERLFMSADEGAPIAAGYYLEGYRTELRDMFPQAWASAMSEFTVTGSVQKATRKFVDEAAKIAVIASGKAKKAMDYVSLNYCRALPDPIFVDEDEVLPTAFPDPQNPCNRIAAFFKRLISSTREDKKPDTDERERGVAAEFIERGKKCLWDFDPAAILKAVSEQVKEHAEWSPEQVDHFIAGAKDVIESAKQGVTACEGLLKKIAGWFRDNKVFVKAEAYGLEDLKCARFITAPCHYVRGFSFALFHPAQHNFFDVWCDHSIKAQTPAEVTDSVGNTPSGEGLAAVETDYSSFEGGIDEQRRNTECEVLASYSPSEYQALIIGYGRILADGLSLTDGQYRILLRTIRLSGEFVTSVGNFIDQSCMSFGSISRWLGIEPGKVKEWFHDWHYPWRCEGDDGLFMLPKAKIESLFDSFKQSGSRITHEVHQYAAEANFCGKRLVETAKGFIVVVDPVEVLGKLSWWIGCDHSTTRHDVEMQTAKALGYLVQYTGVPLVHSYAAALVRKNWAMAQRLTVDAQIQQPTLMGGKWLRSYLSRRGDHRLDEELTSTVRRAIDTGIVDDVRDAITKIHSELTPRVQRECERLITEAVARGTKIVLPALKIIRDRCKALGAMVQHKFEGKREQAKAFISHAQEVVASKWALSARKTAEVGANVSQWLAAFVMPLGLPVMFLWWWWWGCHFVLALPLSFLIVLVMYAAVFLVSLLLGASLRIARTCATAWLWFVMVSSILKWALVCQSCRTAVAASIERAQNWVGTVITRFDQGVESVMAAVKGAAAVASVASKVSRTLLRK